MATQCRAPCAQVLHLSAGFFGFVIAECFGLLVGQRQIEAVAVGNELVFVQLLLAVRGHLALSGVAHAVALFGVREDDRGLTDMRYCGCVGGVNFDDVMAAAFEAVNLLIRHALRQCGQLGRLTKEGVAVVAAVFGGEGLHLAIDRVGEDLGQSARHVAGKQAVPVAAPNQFDHLPTRAAEQALQLVDDAAIAAHRAVEPLQVAVDHPNQVVQPLARGQRQRTHALGLVHLTVAKHPPHFSIIAVEQVAMREVAHEARVVD